MNEPEKRERQCCNTIKTYFFTEYDNFVSSEDFIVFRPSGEIEVKSEPIIKNIYRFD